MNKKCPYCKNIMLKEETVCSNCGKNCPKIWQSILAGIVLLLVVFALVSCFGSSDDEENTISDSNSNKVEIINAEEGNVEIFELLENTYTEEITSFDNVKIEYNDDNDINTYVIYATKEGASETLQGIKEGYQEISIWNDIVDSLTAQIALSYFQANEIEENVNENDVNIIFHLMNDLDDNEDLALLTFINGVISYNALDE